MMSGTIAECPTVVLRILQSFKQISPNCSLTMTTQKLIVTDRSVYLPKTLPAEAELAITDVSYSLVKKAEIYSLNITAYPTGELNLTDKTESHLFNFTIPITGYTFDTFKIKLLEECKLIQPFAKRFIAYRIIKRFASRGGKLNFKKDKKKFVFRKTYTFFKLELCESLAKALGLPCLKITVTPQGFMCSTHHSQEDPLQSALNFIHFKPKKTVSIKCEEVDLKNHFSNTVCSFNLKMYKGFRGYVQKRHPFFFKLTPTKHQQLTFCWDSALKVHHMSVLIRAP